MGRLPGPAYADEDVIERLTAAGANFTCERRPDHRGYRLLSDGSGVNLRSMELGLGRWWPLDSGDRVRHLCRKRSIFEQGLGRFVLSRHRSA